MRSTILLLLTIITFLFSNVVFSQFIELKRGDGINLNNNIEYTEKGEIFAVSRFNVSYCPGLENKTKSLNIPFDKIKFGKVKWDTKNSSITIIDTKLESDNFVVLGAVNELKTKDIVVVKYTFNSQLALIAESEIFRTAVDPDAWTGMEGKLNQQGAGSALIIATRLYFDKNDPKTKLTVRVITFDNELENIGNHIHEGEMPRSLSVYDIAGSAILLETGDVLVNILKSLYLCQSDDNSLIPFAIDIEKTIYTYKFLINPKGGLCLIGGYSEGKNIGMAVIDLNSDNKVENQQFIPFTADFSKEFYRLANERNNKSTNKNINYDDYSYIRPAIVDATIEDNGTVRAVFMGFAGDKDSSLFRNNFVFIGANQGKSLYQHVEPYIYKEGAYMSVGSTAIRVFFGEKSTTLCYQDYQQNYDESYNFVPTTEKIPFVNKPLYAAVRYYYDSTEPFHKLLEVKTPPSINYKKNASYMFISETILPDGSILIGCDEWGVASLKEKYLGKLVIP